MSTPEIFDELVGQPRARATLAAAARAAAAGGGPAMSHAWLITGPPGSGRSTAARAFAAALVAGVDAPPDAPAVRSALSGAHPDVTIVRTEKVTIAIDEVRDLVGDAYRAPSASPWRVIVVEDADRMAERTANVLLKSIEEPPPHTVWLLCAPSAADVLVTIRSRCRPLVLAVPDPNEVAGLLVRRDGVDPERASWAAHAAQSHIGRARVLARSDESRAFRDRILAVPSTLAAAGDRPAAAAIALAGALHDEAKQQSEANAAAREQAERAALLRDLGLDEGARVPPSVRAQVRQLDDDHKRRRTRALRDTLDLMLTDLAAFYRDAIVLATGAGTEPYHRDQRDHVAAWLRGRGADAAMASLDAIAEARRRLGSAMATALIVESLFVRLARPLRG